MAYPSIVQCRGCTITYAPTYTHTHSTTTIQRRACPRAKDTAAKASKASNPLLCNWSNAKPVNYLFPSPIGRRTTAATHRRGPGLVQIFPSFCALFVCVFCVCYSDYRSPWKMSIKGKKKIKGQTFWEVKQNGPRGEKAKVHGYKTLRPSKYSVNLTTQNSGSFDYGFWSFWCCGWDVCQPAKPTYIDLSYAGVPSQAANIYH